MIERPILFGDGDSLAGIVSEPVSGVRIDLPAVIMLNAGLIHRVGPNRLHVHLARRLAEAGVTAFRLDLSGRGDSEARRDSLSFVEAGALEVRAAMDHLQRLYGVRRFVLLGICSGADTSGQVACIDPRVEGVVVIEGAAYPTGKSVRRYYLRRLVRVETWVNTIRGTNAAGQWLRRSRARDAAPAAPAAMLAVHPPPAAGHQGVAAALQMLADRGVEILAVYTGSSATYNYVGQVRDAFPHVDFRGRLREAYYPTADHTFTRLPQQARLVGDVARWIEEKFVAVAPVPAAAVSASWNEPAELTEVVHL